MDTETANIFEDFIKSFGIEKTEFRGRTIFKFETSNLPLLLASLAECHEKLYRVILTIHIANIPKEERADAIQSVRKFVDGYLDRATNELLEALDNGESISKSFGVVK